MLSTPKYDLEPVLSEQALSLAHSIHSTQLEKVQFMIVGDIITKM
jgi:hypothetical protein